MSVDEDYSEVPSGMLFGTYGLVPGDERLHVPQQVYVLQ